jgi:hypothetical protein
MQNAVSVGSATPAMPGACTTAASHVSLTVHAAGLEPRCLHAEARSREDNTSMGSDLRMASLPTGETNVLAWPHVLQHKGGSKETASQRTLNTVCQRPVRIPCEDHPGWQRFAHLATAHAFPSQGRAEVAGGGGDARSQPLRRLSRLPRGAHVVNGGAARARRGASW